MIGASVPWMRASAFGMRAWVWWLVVGSAFSRELDPGSCAARFDVQRDKIIRTEESREMGARYLSELDVGARAECLRLCCETDACDVFVFEEKSPGSCYLFSCGPPEDFRCKFTAHGNFSSGVLALSRRLAELQDSERLATHERDLANLRNPTSTAVTTTVTSRSTEPPPPPAAPAARRCSRYQFECRRGGECIAVYNACDGVPQCADGSDEAPELDCPSSPAPAAPRPAPRARPSPPAPRGVTGPPPPAGPPPPQVPGGHQYTSAEGYASPESRFAGAASAEGDVLEGPEPWPRRLAQAQPHRYESGGATGAGAPHIFSHKGGLLQESAFDPAPPPAWPRRTWPPPQLSARESESERGWGGYGREWPDVEPRRSWPVPRPETDVQMYLASKTMPEMPMMYSSQQQTLRDGPKKGFEIINKNVMEFPTEPPPRRPPPPAVGPGLRLGEDGPTLAENTTKKKVLGEKEADEKVNIPAIVSGHAPPPGGVAGGAQPAAGARWAHDERDVAAERAPAAVLLLVLGSLMTASLAALAACRARAARRRRRARPRLALDADYLVNGMYL